MSITLDYDKGIAKVGLADKIVEASLEALENIAQDMKEYSKSICPKDTGALAESIRVERTANGVSLRAGGYVVNPKTHKTVNYAVYVEQTQPFLLPSWFMFRQQIVQAIKQNVTDKCST